MNKSIYVTITFFRGWLVTYTATALGLIFGVLYIWSVIKSGIPTSWGWSNADKALPYATMAAFFSIMMVPAGRLQDRFGPRPMIFIGGFLTGLGCLISGLGGASLIAYLVGFGVITGTGISFGYSALTPTALKWFPNEKTGFVTGIVVAGVGMAPVPLAPLTAWLLDLHSYSTSGGETVPGISETMITLCIAIWIVTALLTWFVVNPPVGFTPLSTRKQQNVSDQTDFTWLQMVKTPHFWLLFIMNFIGASAGLVFIGVAADLGKQALNQYAFLAVVILSIGNSTGRVLAGFVSDRIGRHWTLFADNVFQAGVIVVLYYLTVKGDGSWWMILTIVFLIGMNYGGNPAIFPAICKDYFGIRNFGHNYGCLFVAFGLAGLIMPWVNGLIQDLTGKSEISYILIVAMLTFAAFLSLIARSLGPPNLNQ